MAKCLKIYIVLKCGFSGNWNVECQHLNFHQIQKAFLAITALKAYKIPVCLWKFNLKFKFNGRDIIPCHAFFISAVVYLDKYLQSILIHWRIIK